MTALLLQTILLMTIAYFIGAALACGLRRMLSQDAEMVPEAVRTERVAVPAAAAAVPVGKGSVEPLPEYKGQPAPKPVPQAEVKIIAPQPTAKVAAPQPVPAPKPLPPARVEVPAPTPAPAAKPLPPSEPGVARYPASPSNGNRFDDALAGRLTPLQPAAPVTPPPARPVAPIETKPATAAPAPQPAAASAPPPTAPAKPASAAEAIAAAAAVAAAAAAASVARPVAAAPPPTAAPVVPAAPVKDDLTLIANIDRGLEADLNKLGVSRFKQIADWMRPDVLHIDQALKQKNRVQQENWIEQAQILAQGRDTAYSALVRKGQRPPAAVGTAAAPPQPAIAPIAKTVVPVAAAPIPKPAAPQPQPLPPAAAASAPAPAAAQAAAAIAAAAAAASVVQTRAPAPSAPPPASPPRVEDRAAFAAEAKPVAPPPPAAAPPPAIPAVAQPVAKSVPSVAVSERDDLQRISGVNAEIERLLAFHNVTRYAHIAGWSSADIERFDNRLGSQGRIARENWVEQAQILSRGGDTAYSREYDRRRAGVNPDAAARPSKLADAIKANTPGAPAAAAPAASAPLRGDAGVLRSVKSEMYKPVDDATTTAAAAAAAAGSARVVRGSEMDDLKRIRGIGVLIEKKLNSLGVFNYSQIAEWTSSDIEAMSQKLDFKGRIERENWVEQARILASGGQTEFSRRVDRGEVETSRKPS